MTKRLQVLLDEAELREIQRLARRNRMTTAEWVRRSLRRAREIESRPDLGRTLAAIRSAVGHAVPTADIDTMLDEIERGYSSHTS